MDQFELPKAIELDILVNSDSAYVPNQRIIMNIASGNAFDAVSGTITNCVGKRLDGAESAPMPPVTEYDGSDTERLLQYVEGLQRWAVAT